MNLSALFIRRPVMTVVLMASAVLFGIVAYLNLPVNDLPEVDYPVIQVSASYPGASPETVAATIATPLERQFMQIPGLDLVTSRSTQGNCSLTLQFKLDKSIDAAATDVQAAISRASGQLPADLPSPPTFTKENPNDQPILYIALSSDTMTEGDLYDLANTQVGEKISIVSGVSSVRVYGAKSAVRIKVDPSALAARGMTVDDLGNAIQKGTSYQGAGQIDGPNRTYLLQPQGQLATAREYNNLIVGTHNGAPIYLRDVATARESVEDERVHMSFWMRDHHVPAATVVVAVNRQPGSNAVEVADTVKSLLPQIAPTLPASVQIIPVHDRSETIRDSVNDVQETLLIAFILVVMVVFFFLGRATDTLIPMVALPMSLLLTFIAMNALGYSLDNLSLMALTLAVGFLVDDAIVFLENAVRRMERFNERPLIAALNGAKEISFTILAMTLALSSVFLPLIFMGGQIGRVFREFAVTIVISILASGFVSLTLTPLMCARIIGQRGHEIKKSWLERVIGGIERRVLAVYSRVLWVFLRRRWIAATLWIICLAGTGFLLYTIPKSFLPIGDSSFIRGVMIAQEGASPQQMQQLQAQAGAALHSDPNVQMSFTVTGFSRFLSNQGFLLAFLKPPGQRSPETVMGTDGKLHTVKNPTIEQVNQSLIGAVMHRVKGIYAYLSPNPVIQLSTGATSNQNGQYAYTISGVDANQVYAASEKLLGVLKQKTGTMFQFVNSDLYMHTPNLKINILRDKASAYGVSATQIETLLRNAYSQNYVYLIKKAQDQYEVILEVKDVDRKHPQDLSQLYVRSDDGQNLVPLSAVATWEPVLGPQAVNHLNQFASVTLSFNLMPGVPIGDATQFIQAAAAKVVPHYLRASLQGEASTFQEMLSSMGILIALAVFVMYVILAILYESYIHPLTVLSSLPSAMVGGLATLWFFILIGVPGMELSLYGFVGLFLLMGLVKKNGILIVDFAVQRVAMGESAVQAIHDASIDRFRPILMTTMAAVMGALPIAIGWGADAASRRPLGLVIVGGLLISQLLTLFITPVIYLYMELFQEKVLNRIPFFATHYEGHTEAAHLEAPIAEPAPEAERVELPAHVTSGGNGTH